MKVYKVELYVVDLHGHGEEEIRDLIENNRYIFPSVVHIEDRDIDWSDDHPLNKFDTCISEYERLFNIKR